jgi:hypothetical protein
MLMRCPENEPEAQRNLRRERALWHDEGRHTPLLGCAACPERTVCGGLAIGAGAFDCLSRCCGKLEGCDKVCRLHPDFADRVREVQTFGLDNVPRGVVLPAPPLPELVPVVFHGSRRKGVLEPAAAAVPLYRMFSGRNGAPRFADHEALCAAFKIAPGTPVILTGTDQDAPIERWWGLGEDKRRAVIQSLRKAGVVLATTPNYSLFTDAPRWDDLHAIKRIALVHAEFLAEGLPAALHVNGRTDTDFRRWGDYIAARSEVTHLAYEFATGTGWAGRLEKHAEWLAGLAKAAGRPLALVVRGGGEVLPALRDAFASVTVLDSSIFMKTMKRQKAEPAGERMRWRSAPTAKGAPLDALMADNLAAVAGWPNAAAAKPGAA